MIKNLETIDSTNLGGFTIGQWKEKRKILNSNLEYSEDWEEVLNWYDNRLKVRYFNPMKKMEDSAKGEGFSLTTIHCALIEHFASIYHGKIHNVNLNKSSPKYEYNSSSVHFRNFLETSNIFSEYFSSKDGTIPEFDSKDFYKNVRCALLHEACTKNEWRINTISCGYSNPKRKIMIKDGKNIKRLFRDVLAEKLNNFLEEYKNELRNNKNKRLYFGRKIDHLCEIDADETNYEWWKDN